MRQVLPRLLFKKSSGNAGKDRFQRAAARICNDRPTGSHRFNCRDAEVLLLGVNESDCARVQLGFICFRDAAEEFNIRFCHGAQFRFLGAIAKNFERYTQFVERSDHEIKAFVRDKTSAREVVVIYARRDEVVAHIHRRMDEIGLAAIIFADALLHRF